MAASYTNGPFHIQALQSRRSMLYGDMESTGISKYDC